MSTDNIIILSCPKCGKKIKAKPEAAGKKLRCPDMACSATVQVPPVRMAVDDVLELTCLKCTKSFKVNADAAGKKVRCPGEGCDMTIDVPGGASTGMGTKGQLMIAVGAVFALIAAVLTIRELHLEAGWILAMALVGLVVISEFLRGALKTGVVAVFAMLGLVTPVLFFLLTNGRIADGARAGERLWAFYIGASLFFALSCFLVFRAYRTWNQFEWANTSKAAINHESIVVWFSLIASSIAFSWVTYYRFLTPLGSEEFLARRLAFTLFFVVVGVVCTVGGKNMAVPFLSATGLIYMAAGVLKALAYDISHTDGMIRIGVFAGCGAVLLLGGFLMMPSRCKADADAEYAAVIEE